MWSVGSVTEVAGVQTTGLQSMRDFTGILGNAQRAPVRCRVSEGKPVLLEAALLLAAN